MAKRLGFRPRVSILHDGIGATMFAPACARALREVSDIVGRRWTESRGYRTRLARKGKADFRCRAGARYLYVDELGDVHWWSQQGGKWSKPLLDHTWLGIRRQFETQKHCAPTGTVGCVCPASRCDKALASETAAGRRPGRGSDGRRADGPDARNRSRRVQHSPRQQYEAVRIRFL